MLWGLGVGYVISGMYFGWNLGLEKGGTAGMALATLFIILLYLCFTFSYTELACAIPKAGGAFDFEGWQKESTELAQSVAYHGILPNHKPSRAYQEHARKVAHQRVAWGGYRLAELLNTIWPEQ